MNSDRARKYDRELISIASLPALIVHSKNSVCISIPVTVATVIFIAAAAAAIATTDNTIRSTPLPSVVVVVVAVIAVVAATVAVVGSRCMCSHSLTKKYLCSSIVSYMYTCTRMMCEMLFMSLKKSSTNHLSWNLHTNQSHILSQYPIFHFLPFLRTTHTEKLNYFNYGLSHLLKNNSIEFFKAEKIQNAIECERFEDTFSNKRKMSRTIKNLIIVMK